MFERLTSTPTEMLEAEHDTDPGSPFSCNGFYQEVSKGEPFNGMGGPAWREMQRRSPASSQGQRKKM